ncbi:MAG: GtrA family protein [Nocardiopsaceae bacterium]|jgi:putative flippase GtrA|nr:GtrA family protein [Nocardiopsaceae bacterium]
MTSLSRRAYVALTRRLKTSVGKRFSRFVGVAIVSLGASQLALLVLVSAAHVTPGIAGVVAAAFGAAVSYVLSRWAWERKGRPDVLRETLPFWVVSAGAWLVLGLASHYSSVLANSLGLEHWERQGFINLGYFLANCVTFVSRFLIFHYVLFADRGSAAAAAAPSAVPDGAEPAPFGPNGSWPADGDGRWASNGEGAELPGRGARR